MQKEREALLQKPRGNIWQGVYDEYNVKDTIVTEY